MSWRAGEVLRQGLRQIRILQNGGRSTASGTIHGTTAREDLPQPAASERLSAFGQQYVQSSLWNLFGGRSCVCMCIRVCAACPLSDRFVNLTFLSIIGIGRIPSSLSSPSNSLFASHTASVQYANRFRSSETNCVRLNGRATSAFWALFELISELLGKKCSDFTHFPGIGLGIISVVVNKK